MNIFLLIILHLLKFIGIIAQIQYDHSSYVINKQVKLLSIILGPLSCYFNITILQRILGTQYNEQFDKYFVKYDTSWDSCSYFVVLLSSVLYRGYRVSTVCVAVV